LYVNGTFVHAFLRSSDASQQVWSEVGPSG
jgi:hypothetical protein